MTQEKMSAINGKAADFKNQRQEWRDDINALEAEIAELEATEVEEDNPSRNA